MHYYPELGEFKANIFVRGDKFPHHYPNINESLNLMHGEEEDLRQPKFIRF